MRIPERVFEAAENRAQNSGTCTKAVICVASEVALCRRPINDDTAIGSRGLGVNAGKRLG